MNKLIIIGNLTKDPELRTTQAGDSVCSFSVAVNRKKSRNRQQEVDYFNVTAWREKGENCAKYLKTGSKVCVVGSVSVRVWETNTGKHGANLEVTAEDVEFLSSRNDSQQVQPKIDQQSGMQQVDINSDELPFGGM